MTAEKRTNVTLVYDKFISFELVDMTTHSAVRFSNSNLTAE